MELTGEQRLAAPRARVWEALNDLDVLKASIPGCEVIERGEDGALTARVVAKVGPVKATFNGRVTFDNIVEGVGYTLTGEGQGGVAGFAKGSADVSLADDGTGGTVLSYTTKAHVGGKLAQLGARLIDSTAKAMAETFFSRFAAIVVPVAAPAEAASAAAGLEDDAAIVPPAPGSMAEAAARGIVETAAPSGPATAEAAGAAGSDRLGALPPWALIVGGVVIVAAIVIAAY
jgi:carbon monoxide dehydrogenase subunit G